MKKEVLKEPIYVCLLYTSYAPKKVISMLNQLKENLLCVRGNCDTEVDQMVLDFPILADYCFLDMDGQTIFCLLYTSRCV